MPSRLDPAVIQAVFAEDGPLARLLPGYRPRRAQIEMALQVARCLETDAGRLVVEAGTGTGKSLAYLVPALLWGRRTVVATGTRALQDQLVDKDAPIARQAVAAVRPELDVGPVLRVKGRTNYLCVLRFENLARQGRLALADAGDAHFAQLSRFAATTQTGDRAELDLPEHLPIWSELDAGKDSCLGQSCPRYDDCWLVKARRQAEQASVVVVNHHLLCADQRLRLESGGFDDGEGGFGVLPTMNALIIDEAHALADVATEHFGVSVSSDDLVRLTVDVQRVASALGPSERQALLTSARDVLHGAGLLWAEIATPGGSAQPEVTTRSREALVTDAAFMERAVFVPTPEVGTLAEGVGDALKTLSTSLDAARAVEDANPGIEAAMQRAVLNGLVERSGRLRAQLSYLVGPAAEDRASVCFVEKGPRSTALATAPIDVRGSLSSTLFANATPVVLTSATLAVGDDLDPFLHKVGLVGAAPGAVNDEDTVADDDDDHDDHDNDDHRQHDDTAKTAEATPPQTHKAVYPSPFDHAGRAALYAPTSMPEPDDPAYSARFDAEVRFLLTLSQGGALVLFTSRKAMDEAARRLRPHLDDVGIPLLKQGERPKATLLEELRREGRAALFATSSFWEGVDVVGAALRLVIIDRLPFKVPSDPLVRARAEHARSQGYDPFLDLALPEAALTLKQGAGRLLRSVDDAGIVAVLDGRLRRRRYGATFLRALPPMTRVGSQTTVTQFWVRAVEPALGLAPENQN
jgi:ATP-dependent DNA helicase DinG